MSRGVGFEMTKFDLSARGGMTKIQPTFAEATAGGKRFKF